MSYNNGPDGMSIADIAHIINGSSGCIIENSLGYLFEHKIPENISFWSHEILPKEGFEWNPKKDMFEGLDSDRYETTRSRVEEAYTRVYIHLIHHKKISAHPFSESGLESLASRHSFPVGEELIKSPSEYIRRETHKELQHLRYDFKDGQFQGLTPHVYWQVRGKIEALYIASVSDAVHTGAIQTRNYYKLDWEPNPESKQK